MADEETVEEATAETDLASIYDEINSREEDEGPARGPDGKFVAKETTADEAEEPVAEETTEEVTQETSEEVTEEPAPSLAPPEAWAESVKAKWGELDVETQQALLDMDKASREQLETHTTKLNTLAPIEQAIEPMRQHLALSGIDSAQYVRQLVAADSLLRQDPVQGLRWIAQQYGTDIDQLVSEQEELDPTIAPVMQKVQSLEQTLNSVIQANQQSQTATLQAEIDKFAADKPNFEKVRPLMGALIQSGVATDMQSAYDQAIWANPEIRASLTAEQAAKAAEEKKAETAKQAAEAKRVADTNLSSDGTNAGATPVYETRVEELSELYDQMQEAS